MAHRFFFPMVPIGSEQVRVSSVSWSFSSASSIKTTPSAESQAYQSSLSLTRFGRGGAGTSTEMPFGNSLIVHPVPDKLQSFRRLAIKSAIKAGEISSREVGMRSVRMGLHSSRRVQEK